MTLLLLLPLLSAQAGSTTDTFDQGLNPNGWMFSSFDVIEAAGGNPAGWLHVTDLDTFYPILASGPSAAAPWVGDLIAGGATRISFDAQTITTDFPVAGGFQMTLLLRDDKGTFNVDDDDYAYYVGPEIPLPGNGWKHFDFAVPSRASVSLPPGWNGGWSGDGEHFRPGVDWQDVLSNVSVIEMWWSDPTNFAIFQRWQVGVDNVEIAWDDALALTPPTPGLAGVQNQLVAAHAAPGEAVAFAGSLLAGSASGSCNGRPFASGLSQPRLLGMAAADAQGKATVSVFLPGGLSGSTLHFQALNRARCEVSAPIAATIL